MKKKNLFKIIIGGAVILIFATGVFWLLKSNAKSPKETILNENETKNDILADSQIGGNQEAVAPENEKSKAEEKKEPIPVTKIPQKQSSDALKVTDKLMASGFQKSSGRKIDTIIIHSSYDAIGNDPYSVNGIINEYRTYGVSAHYLIDRDGIIYRLVEEKNIAFHAGASRLPDGRTNVNEISIGVELINTKDGNFTQEQYASLQSLIGSVKERHEIKYILGHNQIAPGRKDDPWNFDWGKVK